LQQSSLLVQAAPGNPQHRLIVLGSEVSSWSARQSRLGWQQSRSSLQGQQPDTQHVFTQDSGGGWATSTHLLA
jgi:hypothetical protein